MNLRRATFLLLCAATLTSAAYADSFAVGVSRGTNTNPTRIYRINENTGATQLLTTLKGGYSANPGMTYAGGQIYLSDFNTGKYGSALEFGVLNPATGQFSSAGGEDQTIYWTLNAITGRYIKNSINDQWRGVTQGNGTFYASSYRPTVGTGNYFRCGANGMQCVAAPDLNHAATTLESFHLVNSSVTGITALGSPTAADYVDLTYNKGNLYGIQYQPTGDLIVGMSLNGAVISSQPITYTYYTRDYRGNLVQHVTKDSDQTLGLTAGKNGLYLSDGTTYGLEMQDLFVIDPNTGALTLVGNEGAANIDGLTSIELIPEPASMLLFGSGLVGVACIIRKSKM